MDTNDIISVSGSLLQLGNNYYKASAAWKSFPNRVGVLKAKHSILHELLKDLKETWLGEDLGEKFLEVVENAKKSMQVEVTILENRKEEEKDSHCCLKVVTCCRGIDRALFPAEVGKDIECAIKAYDDARDLIKSRQEDQNFTSGWGRLIRLAFSKDSLSFYVKLECESKIISAFKVSNVTPPFVFQESNVTSPAVVPVLQESEGTSPTTMVLQGSNGTSPTAVLQESEGTFPTLVLQESNGTSPTAALQESEGTSATAALQESEGPSATSALEESEGTSPTVVLLYGAPGKGKSTVARHVSVICEKDKSVFAQVIWLECGSAINAKELAKAKEMELLTKFGLNAMGESNQDASLARQGMIQTHLGKRRLLIVLDDLSEPGFLNSLLSWSGQLQESRVKFLVTSRESNICDRLVCERKYIKCIAIDDLPQDELPRMLGFHIGFGDQRIPDQLMEVAHKILNRAERNPLVIATIGAEIEATGDVRNLEVWENTLNNFVGLLKSDDKDTSSQGVADGTCPRSFWSLIEQSIDRLTDNQKHLLFLIGMCKGTSVPQGILHYFCSISFSNMDCDVRQFSKWKNVLIKKHLVLESEKDFLSMSRLYKDLIVECKEDALRDVAHSLVDPCRQACDEDLSPETKVRIVLVCLYLDAKFSESLASGHTFGTLGEATRRTIKPIIDLLVSGEISRKRQDIYMCARQVLLEFIYANELAYHDISQLLLCQHPEGVVKTLEFLKSASLLGSSWQKNITCSSPDSLLKGFQDSAVPDYQIQAAVTLSALCTSNQETCDSIAQRLLKIFQDTTAPDRQIQAAMTLIVLCTSSQQTCVSIVNAHGMLDQMIDSLSRDQNPHLQCNAALLVCVATTYSGDDTVSKIDIPKILNRLLHIIDKLLDLELNSTGHAQLAATALQHLAATKDSTMLGRIACFRNLLERLGALLLKGHVPALQMCAAYVLSHLTAGDQSIKKEILTCREVVPNLIKALLYQDQNLDLAAEAAHALANLAWKNQLHKDTIVNTHGVLENLGYSLSKVANPRLQVNAATALGNLGAGDQSIKEKIFILPGLLNNLLKLMYEGQNSGLAEAAIRAFLNLADTKDSSFDGTSTSKFVSDLLKSLAESMSTGQNPTLQANAAWVVANLAWENQSMKDKIVNVHGVLENLGYSLSKVANPRLQVNATTALGNLAAGDQSIKEKIFILPGLLNNLLKLMYTGQKSGLAEAAIRAFVNLADTKDSSSFHITITFVSALLKSLVASISKGQNPTLQANATWALASLAWKNKSIKGKIVNIHGVLENLVSSVHQDRNLLLAEKAAYAIGALGDIKDPAMKVKIACVPNLLENLGYSLSKVANPCLQVNAATALGNLAVGDQSIKEKIFILPGLLNNLLKLMYEGQNSGLAEAAMRVFLNLTDTKDSSFDGTSTSKFVSDLLKRLAESMSTGQNPTLQANAAWVVTNLAWKYQSMKEKIVNVPGVLDSLISSVHQDHNPLLAEQAAGAIGALAQTGNSSMKLKIAFVPNLLESLGVSLSKHQNPRLQQNAAWALGKLGHEDLSITQEIFRISGVLPNLVECVDEDEDSDLAGEAAMAIGRLAATKDTQMKVKIAGVPNLGKSLLGSLSKRYKPTLQDNAAWALQQLGLPNLSPTTIEILVKFTN